MLFFGTFVGIYSLVAVGVAPAFVRVLPLFAAFHVAVYINFLALLRPRMRSLAYLSLIGWPAAFFTAGTLFALPWALARGLGFEPWAPWLPYTFAMVGLVQSLVTQRETIELVVVGPKGAAVEPLGRHPQGTERVQRPLRIVQISDPHLGPFMSVARLRRIAERAVQANPDLILLTGDFLTLESQNDPNLLVEALAPLKALPGRVFACHGNHDLEAPEIVARATSENGIRLLIDDAVVRETEAGRVQIVGMNFVFREREAHLARVCAQHPREPNALRIILLHDPGAFKHLPSGEGDLVLSGHTHGGQVGLLSVGLRWTFLRLFVGDRIPDHGFWARGTDRMWVHRGTGHYGFPLRLGVPAEESVLLVHRPRL
ncbi:MAG: metallophosphoesterase [Deltaproteobacteria bacterium]|nr:metallophosphoesterase [Deltaproteobacteria bacterium]